MVLSSVGGIGVAQDGDTVNILFWQAASSLNPYLSGGTKELEAASLVIEPLVRYDPDGVMVPWLVNEVPTLANGGVSEDLTSITWNLRDDILWSDGSAFTAHDVVFTGEYCMHPEGGCSTLNQFDGVESLEALDDRTVKITFTGPKPFPYGPFVGYFTPILQKAQFADCMGVASQECTDQNFAPIGTGPFMVEDFRPNDVVTYVRNPNYRDEGKPYFDRAVFKGGGDAESAARAVLETGEADYAWNLQISPAVLSAMEAAGQGTVVVAFATNVERLMVNHTNPDPALGENRSVWMADGSNGHPFLQVDAIWKAMSKAIDRNVIAEQLYGAGGIATCNVLPGPPIYASTNNDDCLVQDVEAANAMLDEAGIVDSDGDGLREYEGIPLQVSYQTSTNAVRQSTQALIKQWWSEIGIETELRNIDAAVFFGGDVASPDTYAKFYTDIEMYTNGSNGTDPETYMGNWRTTEITSPATGWLGSNVSRWYSEEYDALLDQMSQTGVLEERAALAIQMNDLLVQSGAMIPLVYRGSVSAHHNSVNGIAMNAWDAELWNVAEWTRS
ncbi:MAG: peptide ABC transporter substrate-binding protein [Chloroflexi bacterium]|nr:peptide ABC transporter substrate-binding protein [Chloroflexota bacterium]